MSATPSPPSKKKPKKPKTTKQKKNPTKILIVLIYYYFFLSFYVYACQCQELRLCSQQKTGCIDLHYFGELRKKLLQHNFSFEGAAVIQCFIFHIENLILTRIAFFFWLSSCFTMLFYNKQQFNHWWMSILAFI